MVMPEFATSKRISAPSPLKNHLFQARRLATTLRSMASSVFVTYLRLLDAERDSGDWTEVVRIVLHRDSVTDAERTQRCWEKPPCSRADEERRARLR